MRQLNLLRLFLKNSILLDLEYRSDFRVALLLTGMDMAWSIGGTLIFYSHRDTIGGWTFHEALIVIGLFFSTLAIVDAIIQPNVQDLSEHIRKGTLDFVLIKPVGSQLHATLRRYRLHRLSNLIAGIAIIVYALAQLHWAPQLSDVILFVVIYFAAGVMLYSIMISLATIALWAVQVDNIQELFFAFFDAAKYPYTAFPEPLRGVITFVVPVAFMASVPAAALIGRITPALALYGCGLAALLLFLCTRFWRLAVRNYSSASS